jgi:hypothetical protein
VTALVNTLCRRIRPICEELVDALAVPAELMRAEMLTTG